MEMGGIGERGKGSKYSPPGDELQTKRLERQIRYQIFNVQICRKFQGISVSHFVPCYIRATLTEKTA